MGRRNSWDEGKWGSESVGIFRKFRFLFGFDDQYRDLLFLLKESEEFPRFVKVARPTEGER